ncbi:hypothetical protein BDN72DRAFT_827188 [Pluteus cervinus]|uniref:Uncharacterized protein n=1 Tax=Pluteus cervinus TaxID=181527 RepID=A0ACD3AA78_9AGAR|nr:hypothetical protein BDN72DRAFT_827188 [Pluteus cervinus]
MPVGDSLQGFLPTSEPMPANQENRFHELELHTKEEPLHNPRIDILRETCGPNLTQVNTWQSPGHLTYEKFRGKNVRNIAQCIVGQDVTTSLDSSNITAHDTKVSLYFKRHRKQCKDKDGTRSLRTFRHYHLVLEYIDSTITGFTSLRELVSVIRDAFIAFDDAFMEAKVLHRDITVGNIMIKRTRESTTGVLVDWDLYKDLTLPSNNRHHERTVRISPIACTLSNLLTYP